MPEYVYQPYPACRYHPTQPAIVVASEAADAALGPGWVDHPSKFPKAKPSKAEPEKPPAHVGPDAATPPDVSAPAESEESESKARSRRSK
jgi:hypothetical protein